MSNRLIRCFRLALVPSLLSIAASCPGPVPYDCAAPPAQTGKVIDVKEPAADGSYIVRMRPTPAADARGALASMKAQALDLQRKFGFRSVETYAAVRQFQATMDAASARALAQDPRVLYVQRNGVKRIPTPKPGAKIQATVPWHLDCADDPVQHDGKWEPAGNGASGVHLFVNDTGFDPAEGAEFAGRAGASYDATGGGGGFHWHARAVASIAAGAKYGIAPAATVHSCRSLDAQGSGTDADVIECINWPTQVCVENDWACVGNMSLGGSPSPALDDALCQSVAAGVQWAVAGGNDNLSACGSSPSRVKQAAVAGAHDEFHAGAVFSNTGQCLSLYAAGVDVESDGGGGAGIGNGGPWSGTSAASPVVAGLLALCLSETPSASPEQLKQCVLDRAAPGILTGITSDSPNLKATHPKATPSPAPEQ